MRPLRSGSSPTSALKSVDLPAPFGPTTATWAPCATLQRDLLQDRIAAIAHADAIDVQAGGAALAAARRRPGADTAVPAARSGAAAGYVV